MFLSRVAANRGNVRRTMAYIVAGSEDALNKLEAADTKKILYFTASWCPPCKMIAPVFERLGKAHTSIDFIKIDVDEFNSAAAKYKISGVPAFFFKSGQKLTGNFTGASEQQLNDNIAALEAAK